MDIARRKNHLEIIEIIHNQLNSVRNCSLFLSLSLSLFYLSFHLSPSLCLPLLLLIPLLSHLSLSLSPNPCILSILSLPALILFSIIKQNFQEIPVLTFQTPCEGGITEALFAGNKPDAIGEPVTTHDRKLEKDTKKRSHNAFVSWIRRRFIKVGSLVAHWWIGVFIS